MDNVIDGFLETLKKDLEENNEEADMSFLEKDKEQTEAEEVEAVEDAETGEEDTVPSGMDSDLVNNASKTAKLLNSSKQTIRNYTMEFSDFIKPFTDENGTLFYSNQDLEIMKSIAEYKKQRMDHDTIHSFLTKKYGAPEAEMLPVPTEKENNLPSAEELAVLISTKVEERMRNVFDYEVKNITTRLDSVSNSMDEINGLLKNNTESVNKQESLTKSLEGAVSRSADVVSDLQKNVTSKIDRSMSRNEASFTKLQETLDRGNELLETELKMRLDENKNSLSGLQKDMDKIKSNNLNKKVDDLGRSIQDSLEKDKREREDQNKELIKLINEALVTPEYHPEESDEYKKLNENYEKTRQALEKARSAVENMNNRLNEQDEKLQEKERLITTQVAQISALNSQVQRLNAINKKYSRQLETPVRAEAPVRTVESERSVVMDSDTSERSIPSPESNTTENTEEAVYDGPDAMDMLNDLKKTMGKESDNKPVEEKKIEPPKKRKRFFGLF